MTIVQAVILAIVEGITEFLPVSSTGHMILASSFMGIADDDYTKIFTVAIQFGAILSVVFLYFKHFFKSFNFYFILFVGFLPAAIVGFLFGDTIDALMENVTVVAIALIGGGIILLFIDRLFKENKNTELHAVDQIQYFSAFKIGIFQCIALIPGVSRSAATIIGGLSQRLSRKTAAEFSFFLAVPTMLAATLYSLFFKEIESGANAGEAAFRFILSDSKNITTFILGNLVAFIIAIIAMRSFVNFLTKKGFRIFGWYRIILGIFILILLALDIDLQLV